MVEALPNAAAQAQLLAARLFAAATSQGQAILAGAISAPPPPADARLDQQTGQNQGQAAPQTPQPPQTPAVPGQTAPGQAAPGQAAPGLSGPGQSAQAGPPPPSVALAAAAQADTVTISRTARSAARQPPDVTVTAARPAAPMTQPQGAGRPPPDLQTPAANVGMLAVARPARPVVASASPAPATPQAAAVAAARVQAVAQQDSPALLLADLRTAVASRALPATVRVAAQQTLDRALPLTPSVSAGQVARAVAGSGVFLEARTAAQAAPAPAHDFKAALLVLLQALKGWVPPAEADDEPTKQEADGDAEAADDIRQAARQVAPVPPPARGALRPQPPTASSPTTPPSGEALKDHLIQRTEAAVSRQTLLQLASAEEDASGREAVRPQHVLTEIPVSTPQGFASVPFEISSDGAGSRPGGRQSITWRVSFALDVEPAGPVYVHAALHGVQATVTVLAERETVARSLQSRAEDLEARLAATGFAAQISVGTGSPAPQRPRAGRFLDQET
jgi:hypothetical protein